MSLVPVGKFFRSLVFGQSNVDTSPLNSAIQQQVDEIVVDTHIMQKNVTELMRPKSLVKKPSTSKECEFYDECPFRLARQRQLPQKRKLRVV